MIPVRRSLLLLAGVVVAAPLFAQNPTDPIVIHEDFSTDPFEHGWGTHGEASLFHWNSGSGQLEVTWDSSKPNSYFYRPLGTVVGVEDDFVIGFALELDSVAVGVDPAKQYTFQLALGLTRWERATDPEFYRATGVHPEHGPRDLFEFAYFPEVADSEFGDAFVYSTVVSSDNQFQFLGGFSQMDLTIGDRFDVTMRYFADERRLRTEIARNSEPSGEIDDVLLGEAFSGFQLDTLAVSSYSDEGQDPQFPEWAGSILAHGRIDSLSFERIDSSESPIGVIELSKVDTGWQARFTGQPGWTYTLERTSSLPPNWESIATHPSQANGTVLMVDPNPPSTNAFYRVRGDGP